MMNMRYIRGAFNVFNRFEKSQFDFPELTSLFDANTGSKHLSDIVEVQSPQKLTSTIPDATPESITRHLPSRQGYLLKNVWIWLQEGILLTEDGKLIAETLPSLNRTWSLLRAGAFRGRPKNAHIGQLNAYSSSLSGGRWYGHYYHWLVDEISKIIGLDHIHERIELYIPSSYPDTIFNFVKRLVKSNVDVIRPPSNGEWFFAENYFFLPQLTDDYCGFLPEKYIGRVRSALMRDHSNLNSGTEKVYISRSMASKRRILNEEKLLECVDSYGFKVVHSEKLSFEEQIDLFSNVSQIIGAHGAGLTNMLFSNHCSVVELFPGSPYTHYRWLCESLGHKYVNISGNSYHGKHENFYIDSELISKLLEAR